MTQAEKIERLIQTFIVNRRAMGKGFNWTTSPTKAQCDMMLEIKNGSRRAADLSKVLETSPSAVTQHINQLVEGGYVKRTESRADRREVQLELTQAGSDVTEQMHQFMRTRAIDISTALTDEELEQYITISHKIANYINTKQES